MLQASYKESDYIISFKSAMKEEYVAESLFYSELQSKKEIK